MTHPLTHITAVRKDSVTTLPAVAPAQPTARPGDGKTLHERDLAPGYFHNPCFVNSWIHDSTSFFQNDAVEPTISKACARLREPTAVGKSLAQKSNWARPKLAVSRSNRQADQKRSRRRREERRSVSRQGCSIPSAPFDHRVQLRRRLWK